MSEYNEIAAGVLNKAGVRGAGWLDSTLNRMNECSWEGCLDCREVRRMVYEMASRNHKLWIAQIADTR